MTKVLRTNDTEEELVNHKLLSNMKRVGVTKVKEPAVTVAERNAQDDGFFRHL